MRVDIRVTPVAGAKEWDIGQWRATSDFPAVTVESQTAEAAVNEAIGIVLHALGEWPVPPRELVFGVLNRWDKNGDNHGTD